MIVVYGKVGCGKCDAAKDKLERLGLAWRFVDLGDAPEDWRETRIADAMARYQLEQDLPLLEVGGAVLGYSEAMRELKGRGRREERGGTSET